MAKLLRDGGVRPDKEQLAAMAALLLRTEVHLRPGASAVRDTVGRHLGGGGSEEGEGTRAPPHILGRLDSQQL